MAASQPLIKVAGLKEFQAACKQLADKDMPRRVKGAHQSVANTVAGEVRAATPRGKPEQLRGRPPGMLAAATIGKATAQSARVKIGTVYGPPIVFGWRRRNIRKNLYPYAVFDRLRGSIPAMYEKAIEQALTDSGMK